MILIFSKEGDTFANGVIDCLDTDYIRIGDLDKMSIHEVSIDKVNTNFQIETNYASSLSLERLTAVWFNGGFSNTNGSSYENECYAMLTHTLLNHRSMIKIGRMTADFEINKLDAPLEAKRQGLNLPETLITTRKDRLKIFYEKYKNKGGIVCKRITDNHFYETDDFLHDFTATFLIDELILKEIPDDFALSMFQERIIPEYEVRAVYLSGKFHAMSIHLYDDDVDYRKKFSLRAEMREIPYLLPPIVSEKLTKTFQNLNLNYGSADLMVFQGEHYFLEINPTGQVGFVSGNCNYYLENEFAKILMNET